MMKGIDNAIEELVSRILNSDTYREYDIQRNRVKQDPGLKAQIDEYRRRNFELQNTNSEFDKLEEFASEYAAFRELPIVSDFLDAELAFCRMMQEINIKITAALHFD